MHAAVRMGLATLAFAAIHSALASRRAKDIAAGLVGERKRDATYRFFYVGQSLLTFALLIAYGARQPGRTLYQVRGPAAWLMRTGQAAALLQALAAARQVGILRLAGVQNLLAWLRDAPIPRGPFAQGPEAGEDGKLRIGGPFLYSRHPLNFVGIPLFWLTPRMTTRRLAFNLVGSLYFILGSLHEESRLRRGYGAAYSEYERGSVPFFWPRMGLSQQPAQAIGQQQGYGHLPSVDR